MESPEAQASVGALYGFLAEARRARRSALFLEHSGIAFSVADHNIDLTNDNARVGRDCRTGIVGQRPAATISPSSSSRLKNTVVTVSERIRARHGILRRRKGLILTISMSWVIRVFGRAV